MMRLIAAVLLTALLAACGTTVAGVATMPAPKSPDQALYEAQATLDGLVQQAELYARLPRCGSAGAAVLCSTAPVAQSAYQLAIEAQGAIAAARIVTTAYAGIASPSVSDTQKVTAALAAVTAALAKAQGLITPLKTS
jgi:hypothetical protein